MKLRHYFIIPLLLLTCLSFNNPVVKQKRTAIIFGMSTYKSVDQLPLCKNDADSMANALKRLNFDVECYKDASQSDMEDALGQWSKTLKNYDVGLFYYSGHGAEIDGENYLFPVDAKVFPTAAQTKKYTVGLGEVLGILDEVKSTSDSHLQAGIVILDACRDNPFTKSWSKSLASPGLADVDAKTLPDGTFIGYASSPGKTASAIGNSNSPYTEGILKNIFTYESIDDVFTDVNASVRLLTGSQTPWKTSNFNTKFYFTDNPSGTTKSLKYAEEEAKRTSSASRIRDVAQVFPFGSSLNDVIVGEYGKEFSGSIKYESLPVAAECTNKLIKYYWRKLSQSKYSANILSYLKSYGLGSEITDDCYITYMFSDDKLVLISIRLFFNEIEFHKKLAGSFQIDLNKYPSKFYSHPDDFYAYFSLDEKQNVSTIEIGDHDAQNFCTLNWYGGKKF